MLNRPRSKCMSTSAGSHAQLGIDTSDGNAGLSTNAGSNAQPSTSAAEGELPQSEAPAFLLVHGFGAFGEQWRGQIKALTAAGYQVCVQSILHSVNLYNKEW